MIRLFSYRKEGLGLADALDALGHQTLQGYCITPAAFVFARYVGGSVETVESRPIDQVYEARFFNGDVELRWLREPAGQGCGVAVWLAERPLELPTDWAVAEMAGLEALPDCGRLMTGTLAQAMAGQPGWHEMNAPRHGRIAVPLADGRPGCRPAWILREYLGTAPGTAGEDGNRLVVEERIVGIATAAESGER
jgi:hypothetical protein